MSQQHPDLPEKPATLSDWQRYQHELCHLRGWDKTPPAETYLLFTEEDFYTPDESELVAELRERDVPMELTRLRSLSELAGTAVQGLTPEQRELVRLRRQIDSLFSIRQQRDGETVSRRLAELKEAARTGENLMPYIIAAVESYATVGEISDRLREIWGEWE